MNAGKAGGRRGATIGDHGRWFAVIKRYLRRRFGDRVGFDEYQDYGTKRTVCVLDQDGHAMHGWVLIQLTRPGKQRGFVAGRQHVRHVAAAIQEWLDEG